MRPREVNAYLRGEALGHTLRLAPEFGGWIGDALEIVDFRNFLVQGYSAVEADRVWFPPP